MKFYIIDIRHLKALALIKYKEIPMKNKVYFEYNLSALSWQTSIRWTMKPNIEARNAYRLGIPVKIEKILTGNYYSFEPDDETTIFKKSKISKKDIRSLEGDEYFILNDYIDDMYIIDAETEEDAIKKFKEIDFSKLFLIKSIPFDKAYNNSRNAVRYEDRKPDYNSVLVIEPENKEYVFNAHINAGGVYPFVKTDTLDSFNYNCLQLKDPDSVVRNMSSSSSFFEGYSNSIKDSSSKLSLYFASKGRNIKSISELDNFLSYATSKTGISNFIYSDWTVPSFRCPSVLISITPWKYSDTEFTVPEEFNIPNEDIPDFIANHAYMLSPNNPSCSPLCYKYIRDNIFGKTLFSKDNNLINISDIMKGNA